MNKDSFNIRASNFLKAELRCADVGYSELCQRFAIIGVNESYKGVADKINRATFSFVFYAMHEGSLCKRSSTIS